jgi:hypothetical protein
MIACKVLRLFWDGNSQELVEILTTETDRQRDRDRDRAERVQRCPGLIEKKRFLKKWLSGVGQTSVPWAGPYVRCLAGILTRYPTKRFRFFY